MNHRAWLLFLPALIGLFFGAAGCNDKATEPKETFDVTNDNEHCGLVAGYVRDAAGAALSGAAVSISPAPAGRSESAPKTGSLSSFVNFPNPMISDTYFAYYLLGSEQHTVTISVYDLHEGLQRRFSNAPHEEGPNLLYFDGLDEQEEELPEGLYPCEVVIQYGQQTDSLRMAISKGVNISDEGGLHSYTVTTSSDGKYIIADVPLHLKLQTTTTFAPDQNLHYPQNWPYVEIGWNVTDRFIVSATKSGYAAVRDTIDLGSGSVSRLDLTLP
jgi:hypothetical protein